MRRSPVRAAPTGAAAAGSCPPRCAPNRPAARWDRPRRHYYLLIATGARFAAIALRNRPLRAQTVEATLRKLPGLRSVTITPATGSVLVQYDPGAITLARLIATVIDAVRDEPARGGRASAPVAA